MVNKKLLLLTLLLVGGAGVVLLLERTKQHQSNDHRLSSALVDDAVLPTVDLIEIRTGEGKDAPAIRLERVANQWRLGDAKGFPADPGKVVRLFDDLIKVRFERVVTEKKDQFAEFGLEGAKELRLGSGGKELLTVKLGENRQKGGQYMAVGGEYKAYLAGQALAIPGDESAWESKALLDIKDERIKAIAFAANGREPVTLSRTKAEDPLVVEGLGGSKEKPAAKAQAQLLAAVTFINRLDPSNAEAQAAFTTPDRAVVTLFDGSVVTAEVGSVGEDAKKRHFLRVAASGNDPGLLLVNDLMEFGSFEVNSWMADKFRKGRADFIETPTAQSTETGGKG